MTRDEVLARLKPHEPELRAAGLEHLYLFGSAARGEAGPASDIDLMCEITPEGIGLFAFLDLRDRLSGLLHSPVDLVSRAGLRPRIRARIEPDLVRVF
jgi:predicted nucleotidyltransferase